MLKCTLVRGVATLTTLMTAPALIAGGTAQATEVDYRESALLGLETALTAVTEASSSRDTVTTGAAAGGSNAAPAFDLTAHLDCVAVDVLYYCPFRGWADETSEPPLADPAIDREYPGAGDMSFAAYVAQLEALPVAEQQDLLAADLQSAIDAAGKALADHALIRNQQPSEDVLAAFPDAAAYTSGVLENNATLSMTPPTPAAAGLSPEGLVAPLSVYYSYALTWSTSATKQERSYWCGPASIAFMSWHDPVVGSTISHSQAQWASWLGTTTSGTSIWSIKDQINLRLTGWRDRVNYYIVNSVQGWSLSTWYNRVLTTVGTKRAPIQLHPKFDGSHSSYIPSSYTSAGHFNVGEGYELNTDGTMRVLIFEPWNPGGLLPQKLLWERLDYVEYQNEIHPLHNIAY